MDAIAASRVGAAAAQFVGTAIAIAGRIRTCAERTANLPPELDSLAKRLDVLQIGLARVESGIRHGQHQHFTDPEGLQALSDFIAGMNKRCKRLEQLFSQYLPGDDDFHLEALKKGLESLATEREIIILSQALADDNIYLILLQVTPIASSISGPTNFNGQPPAGQTLTMIPEDRLVSNFVPRCSILSELDQAFGLTGGPEPRVVILQAMGGQGKTQLALEYCRQAKLKNQYAGIFWVDATDFLAVYRAIGAISYKLFPDQVGITDDDGVKSTKYALESWSVPWLIVFDNYDDPRNFAIKNYFPVSALGHILVTTRSPAVSVLGSTISVPGMEESQGLQLLFAQCGISRDANTEIHGGSIISRLGYLPLAIAQVGAYLAGSKDTIAIGDFLGFYEQQTHTVLSASPDVWEYLNHTASGDQAGRIKTAYTIWSLSLELLGRTGNTEEKVFILSLLAFFTISDISESLFMSYFNSFHNPAERPPWLRILTKDDAWSTDSFNEVLAEFRKYSLISTASRQSGDGLIHISLHPLIRDWIILRLDHKAWRTCYETASRMLAEDILQYHWSHDLDFSYGFRLGLTERNIYISHAGVWDVNRSKLPEDEPPMLLVRPTGDGHVILTIEGLIADLYSDTGLSWLASAIYDRLWKRRDDKIASWPSLRFIAGVRRLRDMFIQRGETHAGVCINRARELLEYAKTGVGSDSLVIDSQYLVAMSLLRWETKEHNREARSLLRGLLERPTLSRARQHLCAASLIEALHKGANNNGDVDAAHALMDRIYEESEAEGGKSYRQANWTRSTWYWSTISCLGRSDKEKLAREYEEAMVRLLGENHYETLSARCSVALAIEGKGEYSEAHEIYSSIVSGLKGSGREAHLREVALHHMALCDMALNRFGDAIPPLSQAIQYHLKFPDPKWSALATIAGDWALTCGLLGDFETMVSVCNIALQFIANLDQDREVPRGKRTNLSVDAHIRAFNAKRELMWADGSVDLSVDEVVNHLDAAVSALDTESDREGDANIDFEPSSAREPAPPRSTLVELLLPHVCAPPKTGKRYKFRLLMEKAAFLADQGLHERAVSAFQESRAAFEATPEVGEDNVWEYLDGTLYFLSLEAEAAQDLIGISEMISWVCSEARRRHGGVDSMRSRIIASISELAGLLNYLPEDEPFTAGLVEFEPVEVGSAGNEFETKPAETELAKVQPAEARPTEVRPPETSQSGAT